MDTGQDVTRKSLIQLSQMIIEFGDTNLGQLNGLCQEPANVQDYYLGLLRRQVILIHDIKAILENTNHSNITSIFILCRCLLDDFVHALFLKLNNDEEENIVKLNADEYRQSFKSLEIIMKSNYLHFEGANPNYLTEEKFQELKDHFSSKNENDKYFRDKGDFKFKALANFTEIASSFSDFELSKLTTRAFYLWKEFSGFTHYSNLTFLQEMIFENEKINLEKIEEVFIYSINTIELSFKYFTERNKLSILITNEAINSYLIQYNNA